MQKLLLLLFNSPVANYSLNFLYCYWSQLNIAMRVCMKNLVSLFISFPYLQCVKLLNAENRKGATFLHYMVGNRMIDYCKRAFENERALTKLLR